MESQNNYIQIYTITTEGCESCATLDRLIEEALKLTKKKPIYTNNEMDYKSVDEIYNYINDGTEVKTKKKKSR